MKLQIANFEKNWDFLPFFQFLIIYPQFFFGLFYAQLTPTSLLNQSMFFDFKNDQPFSKYQAQKVKFPNVHGFHLMGLSKLKVRANKPF